MAQGDDQSREMRELRRRAEARLRDQTPDIEALSAEAARELVRELQTTQMELELQNEELRSTQAKLAASRDRYADLFEHAPVGYVTLDGGGQIQEANQTFAGLVSRDRGGLIGQPLAALVADADRPTFTPCCPKARREGGPSNREVRMQRDDSEQFWASIACVPASQGDATRLRCAVTDITGRKAEEAEQTRQDEQLRLAQNLEALGHLAGGIAHDFNNMLSIVLGYGELLLESLRPEDPLRAYAEHIREAGERSAALTRQMLAFSRRQPLQPRLLDLNVVVRSMEERLRRSLAGIELVWTLAEQPAHALVDPDQIEQIVLNLVVNAREAMPFGGKLTISTAHREPGEEGADAPAGLADGPHVMLAVTDTGRGMDPDTLRRAFDPFFSTKEQGTGLGLSSVYGIVRQSGGDVRVSSEPSRGTTVQVLLPQAEAAPRTLDGPTAESLEVSADEGILVVEDEASIRSFIQEILGDLGYRVCTAASGGEALRLVCEEKLKPDLVITDVIMPGINGPDLIARLREQRPDLKVLFMSGYTGDALALGDKAGQDSPFIQKPFGVREFAEKVRAVLGGPGAP